MKIKDLLNRLATYNLEAEFEIYVNDKPAVFEICCGGAEGVTPSNCDHVTIFANCSADVQEMTRCKDCWAYETAYYEGGTKQVCRLYQRQMHEEDFCSYGEKRDGKENNG